MDAEIVVCGTAQGRALPDRAVLQAVVEGDGATREDAYREAAGPAGEVDAVLAARAGALDRVTTAALLVHPRTRWRKGENVRTGWRASRTTAVEVIDLAAVGDLIAELATAGAAVSGPYCLPIISCVACSMDPAGRFTEETLDMFGNVAWDATRLKVQRKADEWRRQGFIGPTMASHAELAYTGIMDTLKKLEGEFSQRAEAR